MTDLRHGEVIVEVDVDRRHELVGLAQHLELLALILNSGQ